MNLRSIPLAIIACVTMPQCSWVIKPAVQISPPQSKKQPEIAPYATGKRKLFVFLDGTNNDWDNRTNTRRLFEMIAARENPAEICCYISGVGVKGGLLGLALGKGMKKRILEGYAFLSKNHRPGDEIYIFGFSRGAHQARTLAGIISYCGLLPSTNISAADTDKVWDYCRRIEERLNHCDNKKLGLNSSSWSEATIKQQPPAPLYFEKGHKVNGRYAEVNFIGVWDTVPGSQLKDYGPYREEECDDEKGTRYKIGAYPPIRQIAHAMSLDEVRSKFRPVQVSVPSFKSRTSLDEVWFSGVHSDVGGGYSDSNALSGVSLNWMISKLNAAARLKHPLPFVEADPCAPQHDELIGAGGIGSSYEYRLIHGDSYKLHASVFERMRNGTHYQKTKEDPETKKDFQLERTYKPKAGRAPPARQR